MSAEEVAEVLEAALAALRKRLLNQDPLEMALAAMARKVREIADRKLEPN